MKNPVKLLIPVLATIAIGLVIAFFFTGGSREAIEDANPESSSSASSVSPSSGPASSQQEEDLFPDAPEEEPMVRHREDDIAIPVEGDPLVVTLSFYPELGQISIERYDREGQPTGKPLKPGTPVQIPNPNEPGEKIYFLVP